MQYIKKTVKIIIGFVLAILLVLISINLLLLVPAVQTKISHYATKKLSEKINFPITLNSVFINWFDRIELKDVLICDKSKDTMLFAEDFEANLHFFALFSDSINIEEISFTGLKFFLKKSKGDSVLNINQFIDALAKLNSKEDTSSQPLTFLLKTIYIKDSEFAFDGDNNPRLKDTLDYLHLFFGKINTEIEPDFFSDSLVLNIHHLNCIEENQNLVVDDLKCKMVIASNYMSFDKLDIHYKNNHIDGFLRFAYEKPIDMAEFIDKVTMTLQLNSSKIFLADISTFAPKFPVLKDWIILNGTYYGRIKDFYLKNLSITSSKGSYLKVDGNIEGIPELKETFMDLTFTDTRVINTELETYLDESVKKYTQALGDILYEGKLTGFYKDLVIKGILKSKIGDIKSDINIKIGEQLSDFYYKGFIQTIHLDLKKLFNQNFDVDKISFKAVTEGKGLQIPGYKIDINASIDYVGLNGYNYRNIEFNAILGWQSVKGKLAVNDTNLVMKFDGEYMYKPDFKFLTLQGDIDHANLSALKIDKKESIIGSNFSIQLQSKQLDDISGKILLTDVKVKRSGTTLSLDTLLISSEFTESLGSLRVNSDILTFSMNGNFGYKTLWNDINKTKDEIILYLNNDSLAISTYYREKSTATVPSYNITYNLQLVDLSKAIKLIGKEMYVSKNSEFHGNISQGQTMVLSLTGNIDSLKWETISFKNITMEMTGSKTQHESDFVSMMVINSQKQYSGGNQVSELLNTELIWYNHKVDFDAQIHQQNDGNYVHLSGDLFFEKGGLTLTLGSSDFSLLKESWMVSEKNKMFYQNNSLTINNLTFISKKQSINLNGTISTLRDSLLNIRVTGLDLQIFNILIGDPDKHIKGIADADVNLSNVINNFTASGKLSVKNFQINNFEVGDINCSSVWDSPSKKIKVDAVILKDQLPKLTLTGDIFPEKNEQLQLAAHLDNLNLSIIEPFTKGIVSEINGEISTDLKITGVFNQPIVTGIGYLRNCSMKIDYLNSVYYVNNTFNINKNQMIFDNIILTDKQNHTAIFNGKIDHQYFKNFHLDFKGNLKGLMVFNTNNLQNPDFYGKAFASGDIRLFGYLDNFTIEAKAVTEKGTVISIPIGTYEGTEKGNYIRYVGDEKKIKKRNEDENAKKSGLKMNFDLEVTPDAKCEIIFDQKTGDIIKGNTQGNLKLEIDTQGDFKIFGDLELVSGTYNFTFQNIINKQFILIPGSDKKISWSGDPKDADINIRSNYLVNASLLPILEKDVKKDSLRVGQIRHDINIIMDLSGKLLHPDITFDIDIPDLSQGDAEINRSVISFLNDLRSNEYEMNRQVVSLLILRRLAPLNQSLFESETSLGGSIQEFVSNQVSNWLSDASPYLSVNLNLGNSFDEQALKELELKLTATLAGGRMRLIREGDFAQSNPNENKARSIAGDWSVEYDITKDGKLRLKAYNKLNTNLSFENTYTTGIGLVHSASFNKLRDLRWFSGKKKEK